MPGINHKALDTALSLALDIMETKVGDVIDFDFKDEKMRFKRIQ